MKRFFSASMGDEKRGKGIQQAVCLSQRERERKCVCVCVCVCARACTHARTHECSVLSGSLRPHGLLTCQAPLSMGFPRQEYRSGLPFPSPGDLPSSETEPRSPTSLALLSGSFTNGLSGKMVTTVVIRGQFHSGSLHIQSLTILPFLDAPGVPYI